jgi:GNAT superfamily N-acetyltransferase
MGKPAPCLNSMYLGTLMSIVVRPVNSVDESASAFRYANSTFGSIGGGVRTEAYYTGRFASERDLQIICVEDATIKGVTLGSLEGAGVLIGECAVDESLQGQGHGRLMLQELEEAAKRRGLTSIHLGAVDSAVEFYVRCGFETVLMVQTQQDGDLLSRVLAGPLNSTPGVTHRNHPQWGHQAFAKLPVPDFALQAEIQAMGAHCGFAMTKELVA